MAVLSINKKIKKKQYKNEFKWFYLILHDDGADNKIFFIALLVN